MRRLWQDAVDAWAGVGCIICGNWQRELAHVLGRQYDERRGRACYVHPDSVVPLCVEHHKLYDAYDWNLLPHLRRYPRVLAWAVGRLGEGRAMRRIMGRSAFMDQPTEGVTP